MAKIEKLISAEFKELLKFSLRALKADKEDALRSKIVLNCIRRLRIIALDKSERLDIRKWAQENLRNLFGILVPTFRGDKFKPDNLDLAEEYKEVYSKLKTKLKRSYRNSRLKKIHIKELFPGLGKRRLAKCQYLPIAEIALEILAAKHKRSPSTIRDWLWEANKDYEVISETQLPSEKRFIKLLKSLKPVLSPHH